MPLNVSEILPHPVFVLVPLPSESQGFLLALYWEITPGGLLLVDSGDLMWCQGLYPNFLATCTLNTISSILLIQLYLSTFGWMCVWITSIMDHTQIYSWLCSQKLFLTVPGKPHVILGNWTKLSLIQVKHLPWCKLLLSWPVHCRGPLTF